MAGCIKSAVTLKQIPPVQKITNGALAVSHCSAQVGEYYERSKPATVVIFGRKPDTGR